MDTPRRKSLPDHPLPHHDYLKERGSHVVDDGDEVAMLFPYLVEPPDFQPDRIVSNDLSSWVPESQRPDP